MRVSSRDHQPTISAHKPIELLEPHLFSGGNGLYKQLILLLLYLFEGVLFSYFQDILTGFSRSCFFLLLLLFASIIHGSIGIGVVVYLKLDRGQGAQLRLFGSSVREKNCDLSLDGIEVVNHVGKGVSIFSTLCDHPLHGLPAIAVVLHGTDNFKNGLNILNVDFNQLGFSSVALLLFNEAVDSFFLILPDLLVFFPGQLFKSLLILVRTSFVL